MPNPSLFQEIRRCVCCGAESNRQPRFGPRSGPNVLTVYATLYRKGEGKKRHRAAHSVPVCEECLVKVMSGGRLIWSGQQGSKFLTALSQSLSDCYNAILLDEVHRPA
jgi:hypothetical protein